MIDYTVIQLSPEDAQLFIQFQKRFIFMKLLESVGVFNAEEMKYGHVHIHFDNLGGIASVDVDKHYKLPQEFAQKQRV